MQKNIISTTWLFIWGNGDIVNQARWISTMCMYDCIKLVSLLSHKVVIFSWFFFSVINHFMLNFVRFMIRNLINLYN